VRPASAPADPDALAAALTAEGITTEPARFVPGALRVTGGLHPAQSAAATAGGLVVQDEGSQLVALYAGAGPGQRVLDVCAAPGGKSTLMAGLVGSSGLVVAGDVRERRIEILRDAVRASGAGNVRLVGHDGLAGLPFRDVFDLVVVDAPCSGLGTLRRDPDVKWRRELEDLPAYAARQRQLLQEAARVTAPGGRLVYATCSSEPEENEEVARAFAEAHPAFAADPPPAAWREAPLSGLLRPDGTLETRSERDDLDVYFAAAFRRR
jgi:16S rRNA (cytosine967-C5)-methyltransferase